MKNHTILILSSLLTLSSCAPTLTEWSTNYSVYGYDFSEYSDKNFLFTPNQYLDSYDAIGLVEVVFIPEIKQTPINQSGIARGQAGYTIIYGYSGAYLVQLPDTKLLVAQFYSICRDMGADAVTQIKIESEYLDNNGHKIRSVKMSGFAIRRL